MRIAICDDDKQFLEELEYKLRKYPFVSKVEQFCTIESFFSELEDRNSFDLVLMDIDWGREYILPDWFYQHFDDQHPISMEKVRISLLTLKKTHHPLYYMQGHSFYLHMGN